MRRNPYDGKFIVLEGIDGSGKTTQTRMLGERLTQEGFGIFLTREPTSDNVFGNLARFIYTCGALNDKLPGELKRFLQSKEYHLSCDLKGNQTIYHSRLEEIAREIERGDYGNLPMLLQIAMIFDRYHHHMNTVIPKLREGIHVVSDRDFLSTLAYSAGDDLSWEPLLVVHEDIVGQAFIMPDVLLLIDIPVDVAIERTMNKQNGKKDYFDTQERLTKIRNRYIELSGAPNIANNTLFVTIDGSTSSNRVHESIWRHCQSLFSEQSF